MKLDWGARDWVGSAPTITALDAHAAGEPLRIITAGLPELPGGRRDVCLAGPGEGGSRLVPSL